MIDYYSGENKGEEEKTNQMDYEEIGNFYSNFKVFMGRKTKLFDDIPGILMNVIQKKGLPACEITVEELQKENNQYKKAGFGINLVKFVL